MVVVVIVESAVREDTNYGAVNSKTFRAFESVVLQPLKNKTIARREMEAASFFI